MSAFASQAVLQFENFISRTFCRVQILKILRFLQCADDFPQLLDLLRDLGRPWTHFGAICTASFIKIVAVLLVRFRARVNLPDRVLLDELLHDLVIRQEDVTGCHASVCNRGFRLDNSVSYSCTRCFILLHSSIADVCISTSRFFTSSFNFQPLLLVEFALARGFSPFFCQLLFFRE